MSANNDQDRCIRNLGDSRARRAWRARADRRGQGLHWPCAFDSNASGTGRSLRRAVVLGFALTLSLPLFANADAPALDRPEEPVVSEEVVTEPADDLSVRVSTKGEGTDASWVNAFGVTVLRVLLEDPREANVLLSPLSLATALTMTAQGTEGPTAEAYASVLGYGREEAESAAQVLGVLSRNLQREQHDLTLSLGNGLWLAPDLTLDVRFAQTQRETFDAEVATLDFRDPGARDVINRWFAERTAERIPRLLDRLPDSTRILLGNALYVKGQWLMPFNPDRTRPQAFHQADGRVTEVAMMRQEVGDFLYRVGADHQALRLPFTDPDFEVLLALPGTNTSVTALLAESVEDSGLPSVLGADGFRPSPGRIELPKFDVNVGGDLGGVLRELGLFQSQEYGRMAAEPLEFGPVVHKVAFAVDELGAEAAAATAVIGIRSARPQARFELVLDRPFLLGLQHRPSGTWLFLGRIGAP